MKSIAIAIALVTFFLITNCSNSKIVNKDPEETGNKDPDLEQNSIIGKWQLVEKHIGTGGYNKVNEIEVEDGYIYRFSSDGSFYSTRFSSCSEGKYIYDGKSITLDYGCSSFEYPYYYYDNTEKKAKRITKIIDNVRFEGDKLVLWQGNYLRCIEQCFYFFEKR